jgi:putative spermidine/putrescine transport system permease protein
MSQGVAKYEAVARNMGATSTVKRTGMRWALCLPAIMFLLVFFAAPLAGNLVSSVKVDGADAAQSAFSLHNYAKLLLDPYYRGVLILTVKLSVVTTVVCALIGYPVAYYMVRKAGGMAMVMLFLLVTPLLTSIIMRTFGWRVLFARRGLVNHFLQDWSLIDAPLRLMDGTLMVYVGVVHVTVPFMVLSIVPVLRSIDRRLEESARVLGAGAVRTFFTVTLPLSKEGIVTGSVLVFMLTTGSFVTQLLLGNGQFVTLPLLIFQQFSLTQDMSLAATMGNLLLLIVLLCLAIQMGLSDPRSAKA